MNKAAKYLYWIGILAALATPAFAETRTISWDPVTTYTDNTPIEAGKTVTYSAYWTTDPGLGSLHTLGTSLTTTSTTFDPTVQGMTRGGTVYFTAKAVLNTGEESALSPAYAWVVPIVTPPPAVLTGVTVSGPSSVNEGATGTYTATGTWDNGTTAAVSPTWSENSSYATISSGGVLTASTVTANQAVTVTATYGGRTGTLSVTIVDVPAVLTGVTVSGPSSVNEGATGTYTATGTWDNGTTAAVSPTWSENSSYATISSGGVLTASTVTANQAVTVTATYGGRTGTLSVTIVDVPAVLTGVTVSGPSSVNEGATGTYTATGTWDNGTTAAITPTWSENSSYATISSGGVLTASTVTANQAVTVTATYGGRTGTLSVTIVDVPAVLTGVTVSGPSSVNEGATGTYTATGTWDNGTTAAITPTWSENSSYATISSGGVLTASTVTANQAVTVTAAYGGRTGTLSVTIVDVPAVLTSVTVSGPSSVNEGATGTYTATGTWDNGTTAAVSPTWSENSSYATISSGGVLTASAVTANQSVTVTASYAGRTGTMSVTIVNGAAVLSSIAVSGPSSVNEGMSGTFTATGTWDNGTSAAVSPTWSVSTSYASISSGGILTAVMVSANQAVTVTATYGGRTGTLSVTIVDVPGAAPAAPRNMDITGPLSSVSAPSVATPSVSAPPVSAEIYRINWDPVTTKWDGTPIDPGRTVRYTAYWTDDPALSAGSLRLLGSLVSGTTLDFDPSDAQMVKNQVVYLTVRAVLDTGDESSLAASLTWRVENAGPVPPAKGKIIKK